jgi:putative DNA primase/helicase
MSLSRPLSQSNDEDAERLAAALEGRRVGNYWVARCPAHDDHHPSLNIRAKDGKVLVKCWAGCSQAAVIEALKERELWGRGRV